MRETAPMSAAVFVEFEDLYRALRKRGELSELRSREMALEILDGLVARLRERGHTMVVGRSYAAFDTFPGVEVAHDLALLGLDPQYVLVSHSGRNSADVQLTFDVARVLFRRADIDLIVVVSGNRDFLPLARQVLEEGRDLRIVSFSEMTSGDLRERVGAERFWDALELASPPKERVAEVAPPVDTAEAATVESDPAQHDPVASPERPNPAPTRTAQPLRESSTSPAVVVGRIPVTWSEDVTDEQQEERLKLCLELMMRARARHGSTEVWLSPFLKGPMSQHFARVVHPERRALINALRDRGVIRIEERDNQYADHPYSVIVIQDQHPLSEEVATRARQGGS